MTRLALADEYSDDPAVSDVFPEIRNAFGRIPNLFLAYAAHPPLLRANWEKVKTVMMAGKLPRKVKETIALLVSKDNACAYCVAAHTAALRSLGMSAEEITALEKGQDAADFTPKERALIELAREANRNPLRVPDARFETLHRAGAEDAEIVEALGVMEVFTSLNKFLDALQVEVDF